MTLPYPPPYQDRQTLSEHTCLGETTIDEYVAAGLLPRPHKGKGTPLWAWAEVEAYIKGWPIAGPKAVESHSQEDTNVRVLRAAQRAVSGSTG